jgi:putative DNA primase/helicase
MNKIVELQRRADELHAHEVETPAQPMPNARRFMDAEFGHGERQLLIHQGGMFYRWNGTCWPTVEDAELRARLYKWFETKAYLDVTKNGPERKPFAPNRRKVGDLTAALEAISHVAISTPTPAWLDGHVSTVPADELIACSNGLVHWPTRRLLQHSPTFYVHHSIGFAYDPKAPSPARWLAFLSQLWHADSESIGTLQEWFGYLISGDTRLQKMLLVVGPKRAGKGTIARVLEAMLGKHNVAAPTLASFGTNFGLQPLIGKPVAVISDARLGSDSASNSIVTERLLSISGEDMQTADRKNREHWSGQLPTRIVVLTNELPRFSDSSGALASRFIVLLLTTSFYGRENPNLTADLIAELPGIFNWALDGLERLRERGRFMQPHTSQEAIVELEDLSSPVGAFVRERCTLGRDQSVDRTALYGAYREWCDQRGYAVMNTSNFGRALRAVNPAIRRSQPRTKDGDRLDLLAGIRLGQSSHRCSDCGGAGCATCGDYPPPEGDGQ